MPIKSLLVKLASEALRNPDQSEVRKLLEAVNLSKQEREVVVRSEIHKTDLETICNSFEHWNKKTICSYPQIAKIKRTAMIRIGEYIKSTEKE